MERWLQIDDFPGYSISDRGRVRNDDTGRIMVMVRNQSGVVMVGLMRGGQQFKRGVAKLVADRFLPHNTNELFDTPMHLDGDRMNNAVENLVWRPRWYVVKYLQQFEEYRPPYVPFPMQELESGLIFDNSWEAAKYFGLLEYQVAKSHHENTTAWPTFNRFKIVE